MFVFVFDGFCICFCISNTLNHRAVGCTAKLNGWEERGGDLVGLRGRRQQRKPANTSKSCASLWNICICIWWFLYLYSYINKYFEPYQQKQDTRKDCVSLFSLMSSFSSPVIAGLVCCCHQLSLISSVYYVVTHIVSPEPLLSPLNHFIVKF